MFGSMDISLRSLTVHKLLEMSDGCINFNSPPNQLPQRTMTNILHKANSLCHP